MKRAICCRAHTSPHFIPLKTTNFSTVLVIVGPTWQLVSIRCPVKKIFIYFCLLLLFFLALNPLTVDYCWLLISFKFFSLTPPPVTNTWVRFSLKLWEKLINFSVIRIFHHDLFLVISIKHR